MFELQLRGENTTESLDNFLDKVRKALADPECFSCSLSLSFDNLPAHHHSEVDVKSSFHALYKFDRYGNRCNFREPHKISRKDSSSNMSVFEGLKYAFLHHVNNIVDKNVFDVKVINEKSSVIFALTRK